MEKGGPVSEKALGSERNEWQLPRPTGKRHTFQAKETVCIKKGSERDGMFGHCLVILEFIIGS